MTPIAFRRCIPDRCTSRLSPGGGDPGRRPPFRTVVVWRPRKSTPRFFSACLPQSPGQKPPFRLLPGEGEGALVGPPGLLGPAELPAQIRAGRVRELVIG